MFYKLTKDDKVISISQVPISLVGAVCQEITKAEYDFLKQNFEQKDELQNQIDELKAWFFDYYTVHEQKYRRLIFLNTLDDDGGDPNEKLSALFIQAEQKRKEIQSLENQI